MSLSLSLQSMNSEMIEQYLSEMESFEEMETIKLVELEEEEYEDDLFLVNLNGEEAAVNEFAMYNDLYQFNEYNANTNQISSSVEASEVYVPTHSLNSDIFTSNEVELANIENDAAPLEMKREFKSFFMDEERPELPEFSMAKFDMNNVPNLPMEKSEYRDMGMANFEMPEMMTDVAMFMA